MNDNRLIRILLILGLATGITLVVVFRDRIDAGALEAWILGTGPFAPLIFVLLYAAATVLVLPGSLFTLVGGALFGPLAGTLYNLTGATLGATLAFLIARHLASDWVAEKAGGRVKQLINGVEGEGWRFVAFVRLVPLFPFNLLNYALGLTRIRLLHYVVASFLCMAPATFAYTYLGYAGREAIAGGEGLIQKGALALALVAVIAFLPRLVGSLRRGPVLDVATLKARLEEDGDLLVLDVRSTGDFSGDQGHIDGALNIPLEELPRRMKEICDDLEHTIAIICRTDRRSAKAALLLTEEGFADVHVVRDGMTAWNASGFPVLH